ncbi:MAG: hypothetical protein WD793_14265 [Steroidobacteraceae bacterium]
MSRGPGNGDHWLARPRTLRILWVLFCIVLALTLLAQAFVVIKSYFGMDGWPGFAAVFGFLACLALVLAARLLGLLLKRRDDHYDG